MSSTPNRGITQLVESQANKDVTINQAILTLDEFAGRVLAVSTKTTNASWTKTDGVFLSNHSAAVTYTLPAVSGANAPYTGQVFSVKDRSTAGAGTYNITIAVPSGATLDGVTNGTLLLAGDRSWAEIVFDGTGYRVLKAKGVLMPHDNLVNWGHTVGMVYGSNAAVIPASNAIPSYLPFIFQEDVLVSALVFVFGSVSPTPDTTEAKVRLSFYESSTSTFLPAAVRFPSEDFILQGTGHNRSTSLIGYANIGATCTSVRVCTLSSPRYFKAQTLYFIGMHYEATFAGSPTVWDAGRGGGYSPLMLAAGAQAWPYTMGNSPAVTVQFTSNDEIRPVMLLKFKRIQDIY